MPCNPICMIQPQQKPFRRKHNKFNVILQNKRMSTCVQSFPHKRKSGGKMCYTGTNKLNSIHIWTLSACIVLLCSISLNEICFLYFAPCPKICWNFLFVIERHAYYFRLIQLIINLTIRMKRIFVVVVRIQCKCFWSCDEREKEMNVGIWLPRGEKRIKTGRNLWKWFENTM